MRGAPYLVRSPTTANAGRAGVRTYSRPISPLALRHFCSNEARDIHAVVTTAQTTFAIGGDIEVRRLGFGAMRITGPGTWGPPPDRAAAQALLRRAVELGVQLIDTADAYGPGISEELIAEALSPYDGVLVATKCGYERSGPSACRRAAS